MISVINSFNALMVFLLIYKMAKAMIIPALLSKYFLIYEKATEAITKILNMQSRPKTRL